MPTLIKEVDRINEAGLLAHGDNIAIEGRYLRRCGSVNSCRGFRHREHSSLVMHETFRAFTENLHPKFEALMEQAPMSNGLLRPEIRGSGVYLFSENGQSLYVGRTRDVRRRYGQHTRPSSKDNTAPFAYKLACEATNAPKASYRPGENSRDGRMQNPEFVAAFAASLARVRAMDFRFVEETDPTAQCLLEIYVSVVCGSPYNDFSTT